MAMDFILNQLMCGQNTSESETSKNKIPIHQWIQTCRPWAPDGLQNYSKGPENFHNFATSLDNAANVWFLLLSSVIAKN
jgi:hypothetical protein